MELSLNLFSIALFISAIISTIVAMATYRRRRMFGANAMITILAMLSLWSASYGMENLGNTLEWHKFWSSVHYPAIAFVPVLWLIFSIQYTYQQKAPQKKLVLLGILPIVTILMAWTNDYHQLVWQNRTMIDVSGLAVMRSEHGPYFSLHALYSYAAIFAGIFFLIKHAVQTGRAYRAQAVIILTSVIIFITGNGLFLLDMLPFKGIDITPFSFTISSIILSYGLFRYHLLDLMPIANEIILQNIGDGVLVIDVQERVIFINPAFEKMAGLLPETSVGNQVKEVLFNWPDIFHPTQTHQSIETRITLGELPRYLQIQISPIWYRDTLQGNIYVIHDITEHASQQEKMRLYLESREKVTENFIFMALDKTNSTILDVNNAFTMATGYSPEEVIGKSILAMNLISIETRALLNRLLLTSPGIQDMEITVRSKNRQEQEWVVSIQTLSLNEASHKIWMAQVAKK